MTTVNTMALNTALQMIEDKYTKKYASYTWQFTVDPVSDFIEITGSQPGVRGPANRHVHMGHADQTTVSATVTTSTNNTINDEHNVDSSLFVEPLINTPSGTTETLAENSAVNDTNSSITEQSIPITGKEPVKSVMTVNSSMTSDNTKPTSPKTPPPAPVHAMTSSNTDPDSLVQPQPATRNCFVSLPKLTKEDIDMYKPLPPSLSELDTEDEEIISRVKYGMSLRDRKKKNTLQPS